MNDRSWNLLDEAVEGAAEQPWKGKCKGKVLLIEDSVETSGSFVLHQLIRRTLSAPGFSNFIIFIAFSHPFYHYDRILRKLGCNLVAQRDNGRFFFIDMVTLQYPGG
uniref:Uncharacterized protein MANES_07G105200 n=1 Tax=Rhizophora mucronata TaxID=61149 RepID=A0A2P2JPY9_RHIMU